MNCCNQQSKIGLVSVHEYIYVHGYVNISKIVNINNISYAELKRALAAKLQELLGGVAWLHG